MLSRLNLYWLGRTVVGLVALGSTLAAAPASAGPRDWAVHAVRLGGDTATAQPYIDKFMRYVDAQAGWTPANKGSFLASRREALAYIDANRPGFALMEPSLYLELKKSKGLEVIAQVQSRELTTPRLHLVVKSAAFASLADLKGKSLWTLWGESPAYLTKLVFDGKVDAGSHFQLKAVGQALKGVRGLLRGECDATLLDDEQLAAAKKLPGGADLRILHSSGNLPPLPMVFFAGAGNAADKAALVKVLTGMCDSATGAAVCKELKIERIVGVNGAVFTEAEKKYGL